MPQHYGPDLTGFKSLLKYLYSASEAAHDDVSSLTRLYQGPRLLKNVEEMEVYVFFVFKHKKGKNDLVMVHIS